jgi:hypothetical protein
MTMRLYFGFFILMLSHSLFGQKEATTKERTFQFSLLPGFGTNGMQPGSFVNKISINLTSGYEASSLLLGISSISNLNTNRTAGLQIAGLANLTGANSFGGLSKKDKDIKIKNGFTAHLSGVQISGLTNIVVDDAHGSQFTGGINLVKGALLGVQISGVSNIVYKYSFGLQVSGISNVSVTSMDGVQISGFSNFTKGGIYGLQLGLLNQSGEMEGKNSPDKVLPTGVQIGLINFSGRMNGFQIGLINFAKHSQGTQIGLINFCKKAKLPETKDGTAIGLINAGYFDYASVYTNEIFALNYEIGTGNKKNGRIKLDSRNVYVENALIYSTTPYHSGSWGMGYGLKKMFFNRSALPGMSESRFVSYGIDFQHINYKPGQITTDLSLLSRIKIVAGMRPAPKLYGVNIFAALSYNAYISNSGNSPGPFFADASAHVNHSKVEHWPGFSFGVLLH